MSYGGTGVAVSTDAATEITKTSVTLNGALTDLGEASSVEVYFEYRRIGSDTWTTTATRTRSSTGSFSTSISGLEEGTEYEYRSVASTNGEVRDTGTLDHVIAGDSSTATGKGLVSNRSTTIGETGTVSAKQPDPDEWHQVTLDGTYTDPVVVMKPPSYDGAHPAHVRLRNVGSDSFEFKIEEWTYLDGWHTTETMHYVAAESGVHELSDGTRFEAGTTTLRTEFAATSFSQNFSSKPVVFSQTQTHDGGHPVITRNKDVTTGGFAAKLQEAEGSDGWHTEETIGYIAIAPNTGTNNERGYEITRTANTVTDEWHTISFDQSYTDPLFVADVQTVDGWQPAVIRYRNLTPNGVEVSIQEERSGDDETGHLSEVVGVAVFDGSGDSPDT